ncbi:MAG: glycosyltransferase [Eubacterium sp.]|nr:glycosyltransferase [Eubacterium sp.]
MTMLTIVMPCYNEGQRIYRNLIETATQVEKFCHSFKIVVVNDGSNDETESEIRRAIARDRRIACISYKKNRGKGYAVRRGIMASNSMYTAFLDADLELPPYLLGGFMKKMEEEPIDIVIGSKLHPDSQVEYPFFRKLMSMGYYWFIKILFGLNLRDTQTGIKLFKTEVAKHIMKHVRTGGYSFDIETLAIADKAGYSIEEMPVVVNFSRNKDSKSKIKVRSIYDMVRDSLRIKMYVSKLKLNSGGLSDG